MRIATVTHGVEGQKLAKYKILGRVGQGPHTTIQLAEDTSTGRKVALKVIDSKLYPISDKEKLMREVIYHQRVSDHPNIVNIYDHFKIGQQIYIEMEFASNGDLFKYLQKHATTMKDDEKRKLMYQVCCAIEFIHENGMIHRDIKPENILLDENYNAKICDFGWTCHLDDTKSRYETAGTYEYMSPESLTNQMQGKPADLWSLGILVYELYHGVEPFPGQNKKEVLHSIYNSQAVFNRDVPEDAISVFEKCVRYDPRNRPSIEELLNHQFFDCVRDNAPRQRKDQRIHNSPAATSHSVGVKRDNHHGHVYSIAGDPVRPITFDNKTSPIVNMRVLTKHTRQMHQQIPQIDQSNNYTPQSIRMGIRSMSTETNKFNTLRSTTSNFDQLIKQREVKPTQSQSPLIPRVVYLPGESPTKKISQLIMTQGYPKSSRTYFEPIPINKTVQLKHDIPPTSASPNFRPERVQDRKDGFQLQLSNNKSIGDDKRQRAVEILAYPRFYRTPTVILPGERREKIEKVDSPANKTAPEQSSKFISPYNFNTGEGKQRSPVKPIHSLANSLLAFRQDRPPETSAIHSSLETSNQGESPPKKLFLRSAQRKNL